LFDPSGGQLAVYHKAHLFAGERDVCRPGDRPVVVDTPLGRIGMTICYDLIFPDYVRKLVDLGADFIINSTDWINDTYQREVWGWGGTVTQSLASIRALETFLAMANRIGHEATAPEIEFDSFGYSCIAGPSGQILASIPEGEGIAIARIDISADDLAKWRSIATYRQDRRPELCI
jgi:predicted amidohydrolase